MTEVPTAAERTTVHHIPHTHWDREWYEPFQTFRLRLVDLVDELLERMEADGRLRFTLDGQCATVDDYLEVRPEAEPLLRRLVAEGRLAIGPWQILMDEFLVSGETMVRRALDHPRAWIRATCTRRTKRYPAARPSCMAPAADGESGFHPGACDESGPGRTSSSCIRPEHPARAACMAARA